MTEYVRQSLKRAISSKYFPANETTSVITLDPKVEQEIMASCKTDGAGGISDTRSGKTKAIMNSVETGGCKAGKYGKECNRHYFSDCAYVFQETNRRLLQRPDRGIL